MTVVTYMNMQNKRDIEREGGDGAVHSVKRGGLVSVGVMEQSPNLAGLWIRVHLFYCVHAGLVFLTFANVNEIRYCHYYRFSFHFIKPPTFYLWNLISDCLEDIVGAGFNSQLHNFIRCLYFPRLKSISAIRFRLNCCRWIFFPSSFTRCPLKGLVQAFFSTQMYCL